MLYIRIIWGNFKTPSSRGLTPHKCHHSLWNWGQAISAFSFFLYLFIYFGLFVYVKLPQNSNIQPRLTITAAQSSPLVLQLGTHGFPQAYYLRGEVGTQERQWPRQDRNSDFLTPNWCCFYHIRWFFFVEPVATLFPHVLFYPIKSKITPRGLISW